MKVVVVKRSIGLKNEFDLKSVTLKAMIFVFALIFAGDSFAQARMNGKKGGGWGTGNQYDRMYDARTFQTIVGEVISVEKIIPIRGMSPGVRLIVKTSQESISVHLGPEWYINNQDLDIIVKDKIEVKGSRITYEARPAIIAKEVIKGSEILSLRSENGTPVWSGWRKQ